jgi:hypothetical protein
LFNENISDLIRGSLEEEITMKFFSRADVRQINQRMMASGGKVAAEDLSATSQKIIRETSFSRSEINSAFRQAHQRLEGAK